MRDKRPGYTLLEILLVVALIAIVAGLSIPSIDAMFASHRLQAAADAVRAGWGEARAHAIEECRPYRFAIVPNTGNYRVAPDSPEYWAGDAGVNSVADDGTTPPFIVDEVLPNPVRFTTEELIGNGAFGATAGQASYPVGGVPPEAWVTLTTFLPNGPATDDVSITLTDLGTRPILIRLRAMTGAVTVKTQ